MNAKCNLNYTKRKNDRLFENLKKADILDMESIQNYIPIYKRFFNLTDTNYENVILDTSYILHDVLKKSEEHPNIYKCIVEKNIGNSEETKEPRTNTMKTNVFCKVAPLVDPYKFMIGKLFNNPEIFNIPKISETTVPSYPTLLDVNNNAYTDGFFVYLSNMLNVKYGFVHGILYYGNYVGVKKNFRVNIYDDIEYLATSTFFNRHKNIDFQVEDYSHILSQLNCDDESAKKRPPIKINMDKDDNSKKERSLSITSVDSIDNNLYEGIFENDTNINVVEQSSNKPPISLTLEDLSNSVFTIDDCITNNSMELTTTKSVSSSSTCSSRTSCTSDDNESNKHSNSDEGSSVTEWTDNSSEESEEDEIYATLPRFPVELVFMEKMEYTLDKLMVDDEIDDDEMTSVLMQVIMILATYQKAFSFTHNDLHTNNIMFIETDKKYLYYRYNKKLYRVPTYGRIVKIIDFGRSIYKYNGLTMCSDCFKPGNDASTQYNTEPYFNEEKPRLEPNMSFDLCRLGTSMYDEFFEEPNDEIDGPIAKIVDEWCKDDNERNVLYKKNGEERYPGFKLYKMISRIAHKHTPDAQLDRPEFMKYSISSKELPQKMRSRVMDIDKIPNLTN